MKRVPSPGRDSISVQLSKSRICWRTLCRPKAPSASASTTAMSNPRPWSLTGMVIPFGSSYNLTCTASGPHTRYHRPPVAPLRMFLCGLFLDTHTLSSTLAHLRHLTASHLALKLSLNLVGGVDTTLAHVVDRLRHLHNCPFHHIAAGAGT